MFLFVHVHFYTEKAGSYRRSFDIFNDVSREGARGTAPLILVKKKVTEGRKAGRESKTKPLIIGIRDLAFG